MKPTNCRIGNEYPPAVTKAGKQFDVNSKCLWTPFQEFTMGKVSISSTFYEQLYQTDGLCIAFYWINSYAPFV